MKQTKLIDKENFIKILASMSVQEINQMILERGKPAKLITPAYFEDNE